MITFAEDRGFTLLAYNGTNVYARKRNPDILLVIAITSRTGRYDQLYLSSFATIRIKDELARVDGVGDVQQFGQQDYSMRIWVDPEKLAARNMTAGDVVTALSEQNVQVAAGQVGQAPVPSGQQFQTTLSTVGRLSEPEQFADIVIKKTREGRIVRIKDIGYVTLGAKSQDITARLDRTPCATVASLTGVGSDNRPAVITAIRSQSSMISSRSCEMMTTAVPWSAS